MRKIISFIHLVVSTLAFSILALIVSLFDPKRKTMHRLSRLWATNHVKLAGISVSVRGIEHVPHPPFILMCNHQSALDIYTLLAGLPMTFKWLAKKELFSIPFVGWVMMRAGDVSIDRENPREALRAIDEAGRKIREGMNLLIFPEGTRSEDGALLPFKQGVFNLAVRAGVPIVPVGINGTNRLQPKGSFIPKQKGVVYITIGKPVEVEGKGSSAKAGVMNEVKDRIKVLVTCQET
ncbi:MAG: 1-acyl-sn-glycerol-3-phosphate acyltransferase [Syntrophobacterales bacterium]|jgi:1-acyl-sn-glycerol-3-phosphate acyltransferase|nr:1-acyl-sn-glycerol-3-phosphate acyltransferase [Syntrophobacterales bacterium]